MFSYETDDYVRSYESLKKPYERYCLQSLLLERKLKVMFSKFIQIVRMKIKEHL